MKTGDPLLLTMSAKMTVTRAVILAVTLWLLPGIVHAEKFVIAWSAVSALDSPFWVMNDAGFLKQEGLDMELVYIASSPTAARWLECS
jgi:ABC-type nitrate/sulfonate/bicarbonate transport system substrate-binding protein